MFFSWHPHTQTQWLPAEHFLDINNWDDSLKSSASYYIKQAKGWIASKENCTKKFELSRNVSCTITNPVNPEENETTPTTITNMVGVDKPKPFECTQCGKLYDYHYALTRHFRISHSAGKLFACSTCGKTFTQKSNLTKHFPIHSDKKPFACSTCGKRFTRKSYITTHLRIHSGEKPFPCSQCGKTFAERATWLVMFVFILMRSLLHATVVKRHLLQRETWPGIIIYILTKKQFECS